MPLVVLERAERIETRPRLLDVSPARFMVGTMNYDEHITAVKQEIDSLAEAVGAGPASDPVPTCPDWTVSDLTLHVGQFCGFWTHVLCEGTGRPKTPFPEQPGDDPAAWLRMLGRQLVDQLNTTPGNTDVWTWYDPDHSAAFVARRCAHELAVHRYDAQSARGSCHPIGVGLAIDGIDEMLVTLVHARHRTGDARGQSLRLDATDADAWWFVTLLADRIDVVGPEAAARGSGSDADLVLRGTASDLELTLYGRRPLGGVDRSGDDAVLDAWQREFLF